MFENTCGFLHRNLCAGFDFNRTYHFFLAPSGVKVSYTLAPCILVRAERDAVRAAAAAATVVGHLPVLVTMVEYVASAAPEMQARG